MVNSVNLGSRRSDSNTNEEDHSSSGFEVVEIRQGAIVYEGTNSTHKQQRDIISTPDCMSPLSVGRFGYDNRDKT